MKVLIIILIIIFFAALILTSKVKIIFHSHGSLTVKAGIKPFIFQIYPDKKRKKKIKLSDFSHDKYMKLIRDESGSKKVKKETSEQKTEDNKDSNEISEITQLLKFLFSRLNDYSEKLETRIDSLQVIVGGEDSAETAKRYGLYSGGVSYIVEILNNKTRLIPPDKEKIFVKADFLSESTSFSADFSLSVKVIFVIKFLIDFLSSKI